MSSRSKAAKNIASCNFDSRSVVNYDSKYVNGKISGADQIDKMTLHFLYSRNDFNITLLGLFSVYSQFLIRFRKIHVSTSLDKLSSENLTVTTILIPKILQNGNGGYYF